MITDHRRDAYPPAAAPVPAAAAVSPPRGGRHLIATLLTIWLLLDPTSQQVIAVTVDPQVKAAAEANHVPWLLWPNVVYPTMQLIAPDMASSTPPKLLPVSGALMPAPATSAAPAAATTTAAPAK